MPLLIYSLYRVLLIVAAGAALYFVARGWLLLLLAIVLGSLLSFLLLRGPRDKATAYLAARKAHRVETGERFSAEIEDDNRAEDSEFRD